MSEKSITTLQQLDDRLVQAEKMEKLLQSLRQWDHLETAADGPYWAAEIDHVLGVSE